MSEQPSLQKGKSFFSLNQLWACVAVSAFYLILCSFLIGFKKEQVYLAAVFNILYFSSRSTRKFITGFSIFIVFWIIYDLMKAFPNYLYREVHIESLYAAEKAFFGFHGGTILITPNEYFQQHHAPWLDVITGLCYLSWMPVPLGFAAYLFFKNRSWFLQFSLAFFMVNMIGFVIYYVYPAAPPWYVQQHGFEFIATTHGNTAGLARFDDFFGVHIFQSLYKEGSNVFAAMPSLHSAYPVVVLFYGIKYRAGLLNVFFFLIMMGIWFAAIYNSHHYLLDVIAGICCAITGIFLFEWLSRKNTGVKNFLRTFVSVIE